MRLEISLLLAFLVSAPLAAQDAEPVKPDEHFDVKDDMKTTNAPPGWIGLTTRQSKVRVGISQSPAAGIREEYETVIARQVMQCPDPQGLVNGTLRWSASSYRARGSPNPSPGVLIRRIVEADLIAEVDDNAKIVEIKLTGKVTLERRGFEEAPSSRSYGISGSFKIDQRNAGIPSELKNITVTDFTPQSAQAGDQQISGSELAIAAFFTGPEYFNAQTYWNNANRCVEISFTPPTKTQSFSPNKSVVVKAEVRTVKDNAPVPAKFLDAKERPRAGNGQVSPREASSTVDAPAQFTYQAPPTRVANSGFKLRAVSRAGVAESKDAEWLLRDDSYVLELQSTIISSNPVEPAQSQARAAVTLQPDGVPSSSGATKYVGKGLIEYQTRPPANWNTCMPLVTGKGTVPITVFQAFVNLAPSQAAGAVSKPARADIEVLYGITGFSQETSTGQHFSYNYQCRPNEPELAPFWSTHFVSGRSETSTDPMKMFLLKDWTYVGQNGVIATKTLRSTCAGQCDQEIVTFTLRSPN
jgi:hypothetical protein